MSTAPLPADELNDREMSILDFEREWWMLPGPKESQIRVRFGTSGTTYYRVLAALIERRAAFAYDPLTVMRLRRQRDERRRVRVEGPRARGQH
jgi:Protein of unknown function (DUF3263)